METYLATEEALQSLAAQLATACKNGVFIFFQGPLGAGKTTFVRAFLRQLEIPGKIKSPTYTLIEPYFAPPLEIYHFDLYRLQHPDELHEIGIEEYFTPRAICLVEWAEKGQPNLPPADITCYIDFMQMGRHIRLIAQTKRGEAILKEVNKKY